MKKIVFTIICLLLATTVFAKEPEPQKFRAIITIEYNGMTLQQLTKIEKFIKNEFNEANSVKIEVDKKEQAPKALPYWNVTPL